jgi:membrane fusion protein, copper/silver efflux system
MMANHTNPAGRGLLLAFLALAMLAAGIFFGYRFRARQEAGGITLPAFLRRDASAPAPEAVFANPAPAGGSATDLPAAAAPPTQYAPVQISPAQEQLIGVKTGKAEYQDLTKTIRTAGRVEVDETRIAHVHTKISGWAEQVFVDVTLQHVHEGDPLFSIYSPELVATQEELLLAVKGQKLLGSSTLAGVSAGADSLLEATRRRLSLWDILPRQIEEIERTGQVQRSVIIYSPISGHVMERNVFPSTFVTPEKELYMIVDHSRVWMYADIYESEMALVRVGQYAVATSDAYPGQFFRGQVSFIGPHLAEETRTLKTRMDFANPELKLLPGMFTSVELKIPLGRRLVVPESAVIDTGTRQLVFVAGGAGAFQPRDVRLGARTEGVVEIISGLKAGEEVVTSANFLIDSESQLRAALGGMTMSTGVTGIGGQASSTAAPSAPKLQIELRTEPSPLRTGKNNLTVTLADSSGNPIADAEGTEVKVVFIMPAMPAMGMAAVRSEATLHAQGGGVYRGEIAVPTPGTWQVTVTAAKAGAVVGSRQLSLNAQ